MLDDEIKRVIRGMLDLNPNTRIRPHEILQELRVSQETILSYHNKSI
jgi:hypothetical protein